MSNSTQVWNSSTPLKATEGDVSTEVDLGNTTGALRIVAMPVTVVAVYKILVELETDSGPWEPQCQDGVASLAAPDATTIVYRWIHSMPTTQVTGFTVPCFGYRKARVKVWGNAGDTVQVNITKLNRSPT
jgi:hypothetical protein